MKQFARHYLSTLSVVLLLCTGINSMVPNVHAAELNVTLDELKTAYLFNFTKFVTWPGGSAQGNSSELNVCMQDADLASSMSEMLAGRSSQGKTLQVINLGESLNTINSADVINQGCHILYVRAAQQDSARGLLEALAEQPVLVITDSPTSQQHTVVRLVQQGDKLRFHINHTLAVAKGLGISANLLSLALSTD